MKKEELIQTPENLNSQVVILGAGASLAAFPDGDKNGNKLPIMNNFAQLVGLEKDLLDNKINPSGNFENIYASITNKGLKKKLEKKIFKYFSSLELPETVTIYDYLLLSLRDKDAIFTFNWDPFLCDAYIRNQSKEITLPAIFFLHGNVRLLACPNHYQFSCYPCVCSECDKNYQNVPLLYPIKNKDYPNSVNYTRSSWEEARRRFTSAFTITIFGYGAPDSDVEAVRLLRTAWLEDRPRQMEHIEIIDITDNETLAERWCAFTPTNHYHIVRSFEESRLWKWPRRSCESLFYPMSQAIPCEAFPLPETEDHDELQKYIRQIASYE